MVHGNVALNYIEYNMLVESAASSDQLLWVAQILKDFIVKFQLLQGRKAAYRPGWDCHGLPIELKVWVLTTALIQPSCWT